MSPAALSMPTADWPAWLTDRGRGSLDLAGDTIAVLKEATPGDTAILQLWNDAAIALRNTFAVSSLLAAVHPDPTVIELAEAIEVDAHRFSDDLHLDPAVYDQLSSIRTDPLDAGALRMLRDALRDFRRAGVDRDEGTRTRLRELNERATELAQAFNRNIRDGRRTAYVDPASLADLPADYIAEHPPGEDGRVAITTEYPDVYPFLMFSRDDGARRAVTHEFLSIAWPDNDAVLSELLKVRHEKATLLGYANWPDYDAETKMIGTGGAIIDFVDGITADADAAARRDLDRLLARAAQDGIDQINTSNSHYYLEAIRREEYGVDAQEVRRYYDFAKVHDGLLAVTGRLFGLTYQKVDVPTWHEDVTSYDVHLDGELLGRIHLDMHPRDRKYNHAAQFDLVPGVRDRQLAEGVLVCNFPRGLMDHDDVVTLFHEFGHLMHHVLAGRHEWVRFSGVATEWDFVEAPSQMLEEWSWDAEVLQTFATDEAGTPIPADLVARMREADEFAKAFLMRTQMFYAALAYRLHMERPDDITARMLELQAEYSLNAPIPDTHFHTGFGHLEEYSSAYYTYAWSETIAKDLFSAFDGDDMFAPEVAHRYRDKVLAPGGSGDAADLVEDFLGRPYNTDAFNAWLAR